MFLGAHMSVAGGLDRAFDRIEQVKGTALQIFTRNQRQWNVSPLESDEIKRFRERWSKWGKYPVAAHTSYLINLASTDRLGVLKRSIQAMTQELARCDALGIPWLVMHPGSHLGAGTRDGGLRVASNLGICLEAAGDSPVTVLLETTAGQGTNLGARFEELADIIAASPFPERLGVCFDTCHVHSAGYDLSSPGGFQETCDRFEALLGFDRLHFVHLNDAKGELGGRKDRHDHIGQGNIGLRGFENIMTHPRFSTLPMVLETPKGKDLREDRENLQRLRSLVAASDNLSDG